MDCPVGGFEIKKTRGNKTSEEIQVRDETSFNKVIWKGYERMAGETTGGAWWVIAWGGVGNEEEASHPSEPWYRARETTDTGKHTQ